MDTLRTIESRLIDAGKLRPDGRLTIGGVCRTAEAVAAFTASRERAAGTLAVRS